MTLVSLNIGDEDIEYLKSKGINRSAFMRQAIESEKAGTWKYEYVPKNSENNNQEEDLPEKVETIK